jgi:hypothetical protein
MSTLTNDYVLSEVLEFISPKATLPIMLTCKSVHEKIRRKCSRLSSNISHFHSEVGALSWAVDMMCPLYVLTTTMECFRNGGIRVAFQLFSTRKLAVQSFLESIDYGRKRGYDSDIVERSFKRGFSNSMTLYGKDGDFRYGNIEKIYLGKQLFNGVTCLHESKLYVNIEETKAVEPRKQIEVFDISSLFEEESDCSDSADAPTESNSHTREYEGQQNQQLYVLTTYFERRVGAVISFQIFHNFDDAMRHKNHLLMTEKPYKNVFIMDEHKELRCYDRSKSGLYLHYSVCPLNLRPVSKNSEPLYYTKVNYYSNGDD